MEHWSVHRLDQVGRWGLLVVVTCLLLWQVIYGLWPCSNCVEDGNNWCHVPLAIFIIVCFGPTRTELGTMATLAPSLSGSIVVCVQSPEPSELAHEFARLVSLCSFVPDQVSH